MKSIHADDAMPRTQIEFLSVIEGDPNNHNTIFTTLKECIQLSAGRVAIVTLDRTVWMNVVDIIKQAIILLIARLGRCHLLMTYLGSMDNTMHHSDY